MATVGDSSLSAAEQASKKAHDEIITLLNGLKTQISNLETLITKNTSNSGVIVPMMGTPGRHGMGIGGPIMSPMGMPGQLIGVGSPIMGGNKKKGSKKGSRKHSRKRGSKNHR